MVKASDTRKVEGRVHRKIFGRPRRMARRVAAGETIVEVALAEDVTYDAVHNACKRFGVTVRNGFKTRGPKKKCIRRELLMNDGRTCRMIADFLKTSVGYVGDVRKQLVDEGLLDGRFDVEPSKRALKERARRRKLKVKPQYVCGCVNS